MIFEEGINEEEIINATGNILVQNDTDENAPEGNVTGSFS